MFDLCSNRLLECEEKFAGRNGHRFVEIWDCGDDRQPVYRSGELKEKEIAGWVNEDRSANGPIRSGLRVLLSPKPSGKPSSGKLPFSRPTFHSLSEAWRIPSTFLRAVTQNLSIVTQCSVARHPSYWRYSSQDSIWPQDESKERRRSRISDAARCLLVRGDVDWTWDYTLLLTLDPESHTTYALIVGLTATEIDLVYSYLTSSSQLSSTPTSAFQRSQCVPPTHPLLLPLILLDLATDDTSSLLKLRIKLLSQIQQQTGMDRFNSLKSATVDGRKSIGRSMSRERGEVRKELDLDACMLRLTCLSDWVAAQRGFVGIQGRVAEVVSSMLKESMNSGAGGGWCRGLGAHEWKGSRGDSGEGEAVIWLFQEMFQERLEFVKESLLAAELKCVYLERSIGAQVQTVTPPSYPFGSFYANAL
ncbi:uncharacterized protein BDR25DRAFT_20740 [Lindgomyces ingoldianus]|uniref:Uncharacterized protein n=1 Tax=Lindgomyces ingoldianus TaxID=673940 RepID=A0ACB6QY74_9PLEO|nr:uncharacterized protein BDR25DRAFT_20740 [Lindgomyces ingoldianus]KAF2471518.1 hypothetical protein BDR25DRAFT_20740 [Lindgomyces ingoldianus]